MQNWLTDIPQLLNYFVPGYLTILIFHYVTYSKWYKRNEIFITNSIVISYFLNQINMKLDKYFQVFANHRLTTLLVEAVCLGLCVGLLWKKEKIQQWSELFFDRNLTESPYIETWQKIDDDQIWQVTVQLNGFPYIYVGQLTTVYNPHGDSILELSYYQKYDTDSNLIEDCTNSDSRKLYFEQDKILYLDQHIKNKETNNDCLV